MPENEPYKDSATRRAEAMSPAQIKYMVDERYVEPEEAREYGEDALMLGNMTGARAAFRAAVGFPEGTSMSMDRKRLVQNMQMTVLEAETWWRNGYLRDGIAAFGLYNAYRDKAAMKKEPLPLQLLAECGDVCAARGNIAHAREAYTLAGAAEKLCALNAIHGEADTTEADTVQPAAVPAPLIDRPAA